MKFRWMRMLMIAALVLIAAGCAQVATTTPTNEPASPPSATAGVPETGNEPAAAETGEPDQMTATPKIPENTGMEALVEQAKKDLAARLSIDEAEIELVKAEAVVWPDASLGCPQPDMAYIQIPFDGSLIILQVGEKQYEYHVGGSRGVFLCEQQPLKLSKPTPIDIQKLTPPAPDQGIPPGENQ